MDPQKRNSFLKTATFIFLIVLVTAVFSALVQNLKATITAMPKEKSIVIQKLVINGTEVTFKPLALSYSGREEQHELIFDSSVYDLPLKIVGDAGNPEQVAILRLNPKFDPSKTSIYIKDRAGKEWDIYPTAITFEWKISRNDPRYLEYFKRIARTYTTLKFKPISNKIPSPHVKIMCPREFEYACYSIFMHYLEFVIPIEVLEISPSVEEIKKADKTAYFISLKTSNNPGAMAGKPCCGVSPNLLYAGVLYFPEIARIQVSSSSGAFTSVFGMGTGGAHLN